MTILRSQTLFLVTITLIITITTFGSMRKNRKKYDVLTQISNTFQLSRNDSAAFMKTLFKKNKNSHIYHPQDHSNIRLIRRGEPSDLFTCDSSASLPIW